MILESMIIVIQILAYRDNSTPQCTLSKTTLRFDKVWKRRQNVKYHNVEFRPENASEFIQEHPKFQHFLGEDPHTPTTGFRPTALNHTGPPSKQNSSIHPRAAWSIKNSLLWRYEHSQYSYCRKLIILDNLTRFLSRKRCLNLQTTDFRWN